MTTRRGFFLGLGAAAAGMVAGVDIATSGESKTAFNFTCSCGNGLMAQVPEVIEGDPIKLDCECGLTWELQWMGDRFRTKIANRAEDEPASAIIERMSREENES